MLFYMKNKPHQRGHGRNGESLLLSWWIFVSECQKVLNFVPVAPCERSPGQSDADLGVVGAETGYAHCELLLFEV